MSEQSFLKEYPVEVIPNGINLDNFIPLTEEQETKRRQQMAGYPHRTILGVANRWEERKGLDTFIRLAEELPANYTVEILGLDKAQTVQLKKKFPTGKLLPIDRTANVQLLSSIYRSADVYVNATMEVIFRQPI